MNKGYVYSALTAGLLLSPFSLSAEYSGNIGLTSDYAFRGISQSDEKAALQGGVNIDFDSGIYVNAWASMVDFNTDKPDFEIDYTAGYSFNLLSGVVLDFGLTYYDYPNAVANEEYTELFGSAQIKDVTFGVHYAEDYFADTNEFIYLYGDYDLSLKNDYSVSFHLGLNLFDNQSAAGSFFGSPANITDDQYIDWSIGVSKAIKDLTLDLSYTDTDIDDNVCDDWCESRLIFSVSYEFY